MANVSTEQNLAPSSPSKVIENFLHQSLGEKRSMARLAYKKNNLHYLRGMGFAMNIHFLVSFSC